MCKQKSQVYPGEKLPNNKNVTFRMNNLLNCWKKLLHCIEHALTSKNLLKNAQNNKKIFKKKLSQAKIMSKALKPKLLFFCNSALQTEKVK